ncbi:MAG: helix-turn-helix domain-containing protein [Bacteroidota bacterium]
MSKYIQNLIEEGEHQKLDFKFEISDAKKIARTLVAFSNTDGGKLLIGVKDNGRIAGVRSEEEYYMIDSAASLFCRPEVKVNYNRWNIEGKTVVEVDIEEGDQKPYMCLLENGKWMAFIRSGDENFLADIVQLRAWKHKHRKTGVLLKYSADEQYVLDYLNLFESISLKELIDKAGVKRRKAIDILGKLAAFNLIDIHTGERGSYYTLKKEIE